MIGGTVNNDGAPDLIWLSHQKDNEELRYSIRSVTENADGIYNKIWLAGTKPSWLTGAGIINVDPPHEKFASMRTKVTAIANDNRLTKNVVILQNDCFLMDKITSWDAYHMGNFTAYLNKQYPNHRQSTNTWVKAIKNTAKWLEEQGHGDVLFYCGHVPLLFNRDKLATILSQYPPNLSCDYPALYPVAGAAGKGNIGMNAKIKLKTSEAFKEKWNNRNIPWLSTDDESFSDGFVGAFIQGAFRNPSKYEI